MAPRETVDGVAALVSAETMNALKSVLEMIGKAHMNQTFQELDASEQESQSITDSFFLEPDPENEESAESSTPGRTVGGDRLAIIGVQVCA